MERVISSKPRKLTFEEIDYILGALPNVNNAIKEIGESIDGSIRESVREQLEEIELVEEGLEELKEIIIKSFMDSQIKPGSSVGIWAAEALGNPITQMALNAFHVSGTATNVSHGVERMTELIQVSKNPQNNACSVYFTNDDLSENDIFIKMRAELVEVKISTVMVGTPDIYRVDNIDIPIWYNTYELLYGSLPTSKWVLRLKLQGESLYAHDVSMDDLCEAINKCGNVTCIPSPISHSVKKRVLKKGDNKESVLEDYWVNEPFIDIYPDEENFETDRYDFKISEQETIGKLALSMIILPCLDIIHIKGVQGIKELYPVNVPVISVIKDEQELRDVENGWRIVINEQLSVLSGVTSVDIALLCIKAKITVSNVQEHDLTVIMPNKLKPREHIADLLNEDEKTSKEEFEKLKEEHGLAFIQEPTELQRTAIKVHADTIGTNLDKLLSLDIIDSTRTRSNNIHEIFRTLGLEASRNFLILEFWGLISFQGIYIDPKHITTLVDVMTSMGMPNGITFGGFTRQELGVIQISTIERPFETLMKAGAIGTIQGVKDISTSVALGQIDNIGTNYNENFIDQNLKDNYEQTQRKLDEIENSLNQGDVVITDYDDIDVNELLDDLNLPAMFIDEEMDNLLAPTIGDYPKDVVFNEIILPKQEKPKQPEQNIVRDVNILKGNIPLVPPNPISSPYLEEIAERTDLDFCSSPPTIIKTKQRPLTKPTLPKLGLKSHKIEHQKRIFEIPDIKTIQDKINSFKK